MALSYPAGRLPGERIARPDADVDGVAKLVRTLIQLQRSAGHTEELADLAWEMLQALGIAPGRLRLPRVPPVHPKTSREPRFSDPIWIERARPGVESIRFVVEGGNTTVTVGGLKPAALSPALTHLLRVLASGARQADGFPAFQSYEDIAAQLQRMSGEPVGVHAVVMRINRLRSWLFALKAPSPLLVETAAGVGARFRVLQDPIVEGRP